MKKKKKKNERLVGGKKFIKSNSKGKVFKNSDMPLIVVNSNNNNDKSNK